MTKNRSGEAERDHSGAQPLRATTATAQMAPGRPMTPADSDMIALPRGGVKDSHE